MAAISLAALRGTPVDDPRASDVVEEAEGAAQTRTIDAADCFGPYTACPGTTLVKSCTLNTSGDSAGGVAHLAPTWGNAADSWQYTPCVNGSTIEMYCQALGRQSLASCTPEFGVGASFGIVGMRRRFNQATDAFGTETPAYGKERPTTYHENGLIKSYFDTSQNTLESSAQGLVFRCDGDKYLELDDYGHVTHCTLADATSVAWGVGNPMGITVSQGGVTLFCPAESEIAFGPNGFVKRCAGAASYSTTRGEVIPLGAAQFDDNGFLLANDSRLVTAATLTTRRSGAASCAANSGVTFDADGYLKACTLPAGTTKKFLVNQPNQPKVPATAANVDVDCKQGFTLDDSGYLASCTLNVARLLKTPPIAGVQQPAINCAGSQPVNLYTSGAAVGYLNRCTPVANITAKSGASPSLNVSCKAAAPAWFGGNGALSSCRLNAAFTGTLPAMGLKLGAAITCAVDTDVGLYPDGLVSRCTPTAHALVRLGDDVPGTAPNARKDMWCKSNADLKLSSTTRRVSSCTLAFRTATDFYATGNTDRVCPGNTFVTFTNAVGPRDLFTTVRVGPTAAVPNPPTYGINAAGTPCLLDVAASCSSHAQCDSGTCTAGKCAPSPVSASCPEGADCEPGCIDDSDCASGLCVEGLCS